MTVIAIDDGRERRNIHLASVMAPKKMARTARIMLIVIAKIAATTIQCKTCGAKCK